MTKNLLNAQKNRTYFLGLLFFLLFGIAYLELSGKATVFSFPGITHSFWLNVFFINYTFLGDGIFALGLTAFYLFYLKKREDAKQLFTGFLLSAIIVQLIKNLISPSLPRLFFESGQTLFPDGNDILLNGVLFPSGHTATAFTIATIFVLQQKNGRWQFWLLLGATLVGYSRMYLAGNLLIDILAGACIGTFSGILAFSTIPMLSSSKWPFRVSHKTRQPLVHNNVS